MNTYKIVICGGHFSPALSLIEELKKNKEYALSYIGRRNALEGDKALSLEYVTLSQLNIPFYSLITGRLQRNLTGYTFLSLLKFPIGIMQSFYFLRKIQPHIVFSFGGYIALPICFAAWILRIPIVIHEQTSVLGMANRIISKWADILCLSFTETKYVPKGVKTMYTGNLLRRAIRFYAGLPRSSGSKRLRGVYTDSKSSKRSITHFGDRGKPLLYITGGSLGSRAINTVIGKIRPNLLKTYRILHQCGTARGSADFRSLYKSQKRLPADSQKDYRLITHIDPSEMGNIYRNAFLVIGRSGANTVAEIATIGVPAIFIPLPWAADNEQEQNALLLKKEGLAEKIDQKELTGKKLEETIQSMGQHISRYRKCARKAKKLFPQDAAKRIERLIKTLLQQ